MNGEDVKFTLEMRPCRWGMMLFPIGDQFIGNAFRQYGEFSKLEADLFQKILRPGDLIIDGGANIGGLTLPMAQAVRPFGCVLAFEPQVILSKVLQANVAINGLHDVVNIHNEALGEAAGSVDVPVYKYDEGNNFGGLGRSEWATVPGGTPTPVVTIDSLQIDRLDILKADVEGMEKEVLLGAKDTIAKYRPMLYLENDKEPTFKPLLEYVWSLNYEAYWYITPLYHPKNFFSNPENIWSNSCSFNMICVPKEGWRVNFKGLPNCALTDKPGYATSEYMTTDIGEPKQQS